MPDAPVLADADVTLVEQAISNLTYNAVRYNHRGGHVAVIVEVAPPGRFCVRVIDDGPGIAEADLRSKRVAGSENNESCPGWLCWPGVLRADDQVGDAITIEVANATDRLAESIAG